MGPPCETRIEYGSRWIQPGTHPAPFDIVDGNVTWDGSCTNDGANSYATLSNGFKPYFTGHDSCATALDHGIGCTIEVGCKMRELAGNGLAFSSASASTTLITNDKTWEGNLVEAPFIIEHDATYYLFYSGNAYYDDRYAIGVARASAPTGPYTKAAAPIVTTAGAWVGPGHNSVVTGPGGDLYAVYQAWKLGQVNGPGDDRYPVVDQIQWSNGWPVVYGAPSTQARPMP